MKKTHSMLALLICLALLVSLTAVTASAADVTVESSFDFRNLTDFAGVQEGAADPAASKAAIEALGLVVPEGSSWKLQDCFHIFATPANGFAPTSLIQVLEAPAGKTFISDVTLTAGYWLSPPSDPTWDNGWFYIEYSTDGENWTEFYVDENTHGAEWTAEAFVEGTLPIVGTAGASKVYVRYNIERHGGPTAGGLTHGSLKGAVEGDALPSNAVENAVDFRNLSQFAGVQEGAADPAAAKEALEGLGLIIPEGSSWKLQDCFHIFATPANGFAPTSMIQILEAGKGKVFDGDVSLTAGYWLSPPSDPTWDNGWFYIEISTDGENWTEVYVDEGAHGAEWTAEAFVSGTISLSGTSGASKVYVRYNVERHGGPTAGGLTFANLNANVKSASGGNADDTGDMIGVVVALLAVSGMGIAVLKKREN